MRADGFGGHENEVVESAAKRAESESQMNEPINQEHEDVLNFAHSLPSGLTQEQIYIRIHERARATPPAAAAAGLPADEPTPYAWVRTAVICDDAGYAIGMDEPEFRVGAESPGDDIDGNWSPLFFAPALPADPVDESQPAAQWISVDERLPEKSGDVLIAFWPFDNRENKQVATQAFYTDGSFLTWENGDDHHPPSHWMPLTLPAMEAQSHE